MEDFDESKFRRRKDGEKVQYGDWIGTYHDGIVKLVEEGFVTDLLEGLTVPLKSYDVVFAPKD